MSKVNIQRPNHLAVNDAVSEGYVDELFNVRVIHTDETPVRITKRLEDGSTTPDTSEHTTFNAYVRVYSNATATVLTANGYKTMRVLSETESLTGSRESSATTMMRS